jgi:5-(carboxyamino)imidazole ribonucleotide synthase
MRQAGAVRVGVVGAGQLARMLQQAAIPLGVELRLLATDPAEPALRVVRDAVVGGTLAELAEGCDVVTFEHELVDLDEVAALEAAGVAVRPSSAALRSVVDKRSTRTLLAAHDLPQPVWRPVESVADVPSYPAVLKASRGGYDGRGVWEVADATAAGKVFASGLPLLAEERVAIDQELALLLARRPGGEIATYPVVETVQRDGICVEVVAPAAVDEAVAKAATELAVEVAEAVGVVGLLAVELFRVGDRLLVNELAARPHNSGHWTIEGAATSQFEQHLRAVLDLPLGPTTPRAPVTVMANVIGGEPEARLAEALAVGDVHVHLYGKEPRPGRKLGHVTAVGDDVDQVRDRAERAAAVLSS